jgi:transcriptional regulator with XRE-family HTH domain
MYRLFGDKLRLLRQQSQLSQAELARRLDISRSFVNNLEAGRKGPSIKIVLQAADFFGVTTDYLLKDTLSIQREKPSAHVGDIPKLSTLTLFAPKLNYLRSATGLTQTDLAHRLDLVANAHISYLEGGTKEPSLDLVLRIAELFSVSTDYLLRDAIPIDRSEGRSENAPAE